MHVLPSLLFVAALQFQAPGLEFPSGITLDSDENIVVADRRANRVFRVDATTGSVEVIAGSGRAGFSNDGNLAINADLLHPEWVAYDATGNLFVADRGNHRVRKIDHRTGVITTVAGTGEFLSNGDGGPATEAALTNPFGIVFDESDNLFIFDTETHMIRRVGAETGVIETVIGSGVEGFSGDDGPAEQAQLRRPHNGVFDREGSLVFGDSFNQRIRRWNPATEYVTTIGGNGAQGAVRVGVPATDTPFTFFGGFALGANGDIVFTSLDNRIFRINSASERIELVAGTGAEGFAGDGGAASLAQLATPYGIAIADDGTIFFADAGNSRIRRIDHSGIITTVAGN